MSLPKPLLWLPRKYIEEERHRLAQQQPETFLMITLGYEEVFGVKPSWDQLVDRIKKYSLRQVLGCLGRISGVLHQLERRHPEAQKRVCDGLFGNKSPDVWSGVLRWIGKERDPGAPQSTPALFHELQLINLAKVALLTLDVDRNENRDSLAELGEALLMLNNLQEGVLGNNPGVDQSTTEGVRAWHQHFIANGLFHHGDTEVHVLPRAYDLYLSDKPQLRGHSAYLDLPAAVHEATGLQPDTLWFILFALMAHWRNIDPEAVASGVWMMSRSKYFSTLEFSKEDTDTFFDLVSADVHVMQELVQARYSLDNLRTFDVMPFAKKPLVSFGDIVSCISVKLLTGKLTNGLHHLFLDEAKFDKTRRGRFLDYMGTVFEDYLGRLLARVYPPSANRYLGPEELKGAITGKSCDFVIHYGDALVLIEAKATRFSLAARTEASWSDYERAFNEIFLDGASQIDNTVNAIEAGLLLHFGVDPAVIHAYIPLIVTLEDLPMNRVIYRKVREDLDKAHLLEQAKVRPLQATDVGEMEFLEIGMNEGRSLRDILQEKVATEENRDQSLGNYLLQRDEPFMRQGYVNKYLGDLFTGLGDRALEAFRARKRPESGE